MEYDEKVAMVRDIALQIILLLIALFMFLAIYGIPQRLFANLKHRLRNPKPTNVEAKRHFVRGAQLLAQARSPKNRSNSASLAADSLTEAEKAIALDPKDAASHILKAMVLDLQGFRSSALDSLDMALSPLGAASLDDGERGDALLKRVELRMEVSGRGLVDSVLEDLSESVKLSPKNVNGWCLLGECYEGKKMAEEARKAYKEALVLEPELAAAKEALNRLGSS